MGALNSLPIKVGGVLLASGASRRMKSIKQLLDWHGTYLINHVINEILKSQINELFVILGDHFDEINQLIDTRPKIIHNPNWIIGKSSSIKRGIMSAGNFTDGIIFFLVDQPYVDKLIINTLINKFKKSTENIIVPRVNGQLCNPVLFGKKYYRKLMNLSGEQGGKEIIREVNDVEWIAWEDEKLLLDIDTEVDYKNILENYPSASC